MELRNTTSFSATALPMPGPGNRPALVVIVKATFDFAMDKTVPSADQQPIAFGDSFYAEEEGGGIRYESDLAPFKPMTDVVLCGSAHAPDNKPSTYVDVRLGVGPVHKTLRVFGKRLWNHAGILRRRRYVATPPQPFVTQPIRYSESFGGVDETTGEYCEHNLSGKGFYSVKTTANLAGRPLPLIEDPAHLIQTPGDHPPPAGLGFYHRSWQPRARYAGSFDKAWRTRRSPLMPENFNYRFYNGAHRDLQAQNYLIGNEPVTMDNLTPQGRLRFHLPGIAPHCLLQRAGAKKEENVPMHLDTVFIEADHYHLCLIWRCLAGLEALSDATIERVIIKTTPLTQ